MATETMGTPYVRPVPEVRRGILTGRPIKISWSGIFAGVVASLGVWILLYALGLALGLSTVDPNAPSSLKASGVFTGIWGGIVPLIALFVGGFVAARGGGAFDRSEGALHGLVVWGTAMLLGVYLIGGALGGLLAGLGGVGQTALQAGVAAQGLAQKRAEEGTVRELDAEVALQPLNERLVAEGQPPISGEQLRAATKDVWEQAVKDGKMDRELLLQSLAINTPLQRPDAEELADRVQEQFGQTRGQVAVQTAKAADTTGKLFWGVFAALLLGMGAAIAGGVLGVSRREVVTG